MGRIWANRATYIVQMGLHMDQSESFLKENYEHSARYPVLIKAVFVHICLLCKHERRVFKACTKPKIRTTQSLPSRVILARGPSSLDLKSELFL